MAAPRDREQANPLVRSMRSTVGRESTTFGFSILVTVTFGLVQSTHGSPTTPQIFLYAVGAVMSFTLLEGVVSVLSVVTAMAAAWGFDEVTGPRIAWAGAPLIAGLVYLLIESLEEALAERVLVASGDTDAEQVSNQDS
jgi:hypothetical protein